MIAIPRSPSSPDVTAAPPVAESPAMRDLVRTLGEVAPTPTTLLLLGPAGSGRGRLARLVHARSGRGGPCLEVRCDGEPERVLLALGRAIASAAGGSVILREVGALPAAGQAALVRALAERPDESGRAARLIATAGPGLAARAATGDFRSDLFYRLNVFPVAVPPLRKRLEDLAGLAESILLEEGGVDGPPRTLGDDALASLRAQPPASVGELALLLRRASARAGRTIGVADLGLVPTPAAEARFPEELPLDLTRLERLAIEEALRRAGGNRTHAARLLGIGLRTLRNKLAAWRAAGEQVPPAPGARQDGPAPDGPGAAATAAILARSWARRSQERSA